jgi:S1/P1 Nuclease
MSQLPLRLIVLLAAITMMPVQARAWNIPGHMLSGAIAYQILEREHPATIPAVRSILERHPWYEARWRDDLAKLPASEQGEMLFMLAARWADDIRMQAKVERHIFWHFINWPFKPPGEPADIKELPPNQENILSAIAENERALRSEAPADQRAIALAWLFHLVGDIHQPLHSTQLFTREYPYGDRGGNEMCVRVAPDRNAISLHRLWDGLFTTSRDARTLSNHAIDLRRRFPAIELFELTKAAPEAWGKESFQIATKIGYENGQLRGTPRGQHKDCRDVSDAQVLPDGYLKIARQIADRRMTLAGYRLAAELNRLTTK